MALTKVRSPVTDITSMSFGTTDVTITSTGGPIDVDVGGSNVVDLTSTTADFDDAITVTANLFQTEVVSIDTSAGASATLRTNGTEGRLGTDTAHPLILYSNLLSALTLETDAKVTLGVVGTAAGHLVDKNYVDTQDASGVTLATLLGTTATTGSISIPNSSGNNIIINWGVSPTISNTQTAVTFNTAFPNAAFVGLATRQNGTSSLESSAHINSLTTTGMNVVNSGGTSSPVGYIAIGF